MAFPNSSITDVIATTLESRAPVVRDNVSDNNALLAKLKLKGKARRPISGGRTIFEAFSFAENGNGASYSGYDTLSVAASDVLSGAEFGIKQYAVPVSISGLEQLMNSGPEQLMDLMEERVNVAEATLLNLLSAGVYSDGTTNSSKVITGLAAAVPTDPTTGTYGGIDRSDTANTFWRSQKVDSQTSTSAVQGIMNQLWALCTRGVDSPDLITMGNAFWADYMGSLQAIQRLSDSKMAQLGFSTVKYMNADCVLDGGIGGNETTDNARFLNTKYLHWRPHKNRDVVPLKPRVPTNQDAEIVILAWAGNLTCSGAQFQGIILGD